jgi:hypothetical protein
MQTAEPREEHRWLERLVGEWTFEMEAIGQSGEPPHKDAGMESVRSLGGVWVVCEGHGQMPDGSPATSIVTLGYDPAKERFVGTFVGSMMTHLWLYDGELDPAGNVLTLNTEGPSFTDEGKMAKYCDTIELRSDDHRVMTSSVQNADGSWTQFVTSHYRRTK